MRINLLLDILQPVPVGSVKVLLPVGSVGESLVEIGTHSGGKRLEAVVKGVDRVDSSLELGRGLLASQKAVDEGHLGETGPHGVGGSLGLGRAGSKTHDVSDDDTAVFVEKAVLIDNIVAVSLNILEGEHARGSKHVKTGSLALEMLVVEVKPLAILNSLLLINNTRSIEGSEHGSKDGIELSSSLARSKHRDGAERVRTSKAQLVVDEHLCVQVRLIERVVNLDTLPALLDGVGSVGYVENVARDDHVREGLDSDRDGNTPGGGSSAPHGPEEILVGGGVGLDEASVRGDNLILEDVVDSKTVLSEERTVSSSLDEASSETDTLLSVSICSRF